MCEILDRIKEFIDYKGIPIAAFEKSVGMSNASFGKQLKKKGAIGTDKLENILRHYTDLSPLWLMTGEGDMLKSQSKPNTSSEEAEVYSISYSHKDKKINTINKRSSRVYIAEDEVETRPRIPFEATAGCLSIALDGVTEDQCERFPVIPSLPDYDFTIITRGNSMEPEFQSGDELACRFVHESNFIQWGRTYILDTAQGVVLKNIYNEKEYIRCRSINPDYPDFTIPKDEIYHLAIVVGLVRHF